MGVQESMNKYLQSSKTRFGVTGNKRNILVRHWQSLHGTKCICSGLGTVYWHLVGYRFGIMYIYIVCLI
ncbi:hypothetical protein BCR42DRAFT_415433 [Absidia repens]|uniref:Uncharacterized protein n=1 Tax=Absidia repens TaxID=90262 RepID=A0A1X2IJ60_9FUNG|nr:hypothetical protein BCR42DRAFT_415433 [Absidia repens]